MKNNMKTIIVLILVIFMFITLIIPNNVFAALPYVWEEYEGVENPDSISEGEVGAIINKLLLIDVNKLSEDEIDKALSFSKMIGKHSHISMIQTDEDRNTI